MPNGRRFFVPKSIVVRSNSTGRKAKMPSINFATNFIKIMKTYRRPNSIGDRISKNKPTTKQRIWKSS